MGQQGIYLAFPTDDDSYVLPDDLVNHYLDEDETATKTVGWLKSKTKAKSDHGVQGFHRVVKATKEKKQIIELDIPNYNDETLANLIKLADKGDFMLFMSAKERDELTE